MRTFEEIKAAWPDTITSDEQLMLTDLVDELGRALNTFAAWMEANPVVYVKAPGRHDMVEVQMPMTMANVSELLLMLTDDDAEDA